MTDEQALARLDTLLDMNVYERSEQLERLSIEDPILHGRLVRLLAAASAANSSQVLVQPFVDGLCAVQHSATPPLGTGQAIAGYRLLRELGRGGMSVVWLAERIDGIVKRQVALKLPLFVLMSPLEVERFAREKDALATLTHPHIARLYDAGVTASGQPFIVLEFVDGLPITAYCDRHQLGLPARLRLFLQVLAAVDHAHKHLIVHRDLKPSNILVDAQGQVKLLDFGIAKLLTEPGSGDPRLQLTQQGTMALTPLYAAPEQVSGQSISTLTDVYVLGVVLHELLTGTLLYANADGGPMSLLQVLEALKAGASTQPSRAPIAEEAARARAAPNAKRLRIMLSGDLDTIVCKAMSLAPAERFASVERLAADVTSFLSQLPIAARPHKWTYSSRLFLRRHRATSITAGIGVICFIVAAAVAFHQYLLSRAYATRTAIVRDFMFDLIEDVEPDESHPDSPVTGKQIVDSAVRRARSNFGDQPALRGELLSELGRMYMRLDEPESAKQLLTEALALLERNVPSGDSALNKTRAQLANVLLEENDAVRASALATLSLRSCTQQSADCAKARAYSDGVLSRVSLNSGRVEQSLAQMRDAVRETALGFGEQDAESAMTLLNLALIARNAGHLREAGAAMEQALNIAEQKTLPAADRTHLLLSAAVLDLDLGRYDRARERLTSLVAGTENAQQRALQLRLLANALMAQGEPITALDIAGSAIALGDPNHVTAEVLYARQVHAQALALLGRFTESEEEILAVVAGLRGLGRAEQSPEMLRAHRITGEILLRAGRADDAFQELDSLAAQLRAAPESHELEFGQTLDLLGCALRELNRSAEAVARHEEARVRLEKQLPANHPFLDRNTLYRMAAGRDERAFRQQAASVEARWALTSVWRALVESHEAPSACRGPGACVLVL
jgi:eukaryotic-like serine/threonine-protein kinase